MDELWRGPTTRETKLPLAEGWSILNRAVPCNPGEEVAVVRVDSLPTHDQVWDALAETWTDEGEYDLDIMADVIVALFGQTEGADGG